MSAPTGARFMWALAVVGASCVTTLSGYSFAGSPEGQWLVGVWEGSGAGRYVVRDARRCDFAHGNGAITWKCSGSGEYRTTAGATGGRRLAIEKLEFAWSGLVTKISDSEIDLKGNVDAHTDPSRVGKVVQCTLKKSGDGDALEGFCLTAGHVSTPMSLRKIK